MASTLLLLEDDPDLASLHAAPAADAVEAAVRRALPLFGTLLDTVPWPVLERAAHVAERLVSPGFVTHYALRKLGVRRALAAAVDAGARQVILVGAGFDMLSATVPKGVPVFEVDHPATQSYRGESEGVTLVPVDLATGSMLSALRRTPAFDATLPTVFVAEGLLMYLDEERVHRVLGEIASGPGARTLILSIVTPDAAGRLRLHSQRRVVDWIMRFIDEPFLWGAAPNELERTLHRHGLVLKSVQTTMDLRDELLPVSAHRRLPRPSGEIIVVAEGLAA
ncbi:MAG: SAM-dependent methyltransferase [Labilithrix sp.]